MKNFATKVSALAQAGKSFFFVVDFDNKNPEVFAMEDLPKETHFSIPGFSTPCPTGLTPERFYFRSFPPAFKEYRNTFDTVKKQISLGNSYLLNLTFESLIETNLTLAGIYNLSNAPYKLLYKGRFVVFSPETFITINGHYISSYPMKGTIDANLPNAADILLNDKKEHAEHNTIVDLIRNDLAMVSENVKVEKFKYLQKIKTHQSELLQMSSKITGRLPTDFKEKLGDIIFKLLPAGSISGAPKAKTLDIIRSTEKTKRGYYTGIFGFYDGQNLQSAVMIRFIEQRNEGLFFKSGGGITFMSNPENEYNELMQKIYLPLDVNLLQR
jgi:para-aminobenzoate synthetase component I